MSDSHSHSPLAQFAVEPLVPIRLGGLDISFTNASLWMMVVTFGIILFFSLASRKAALVPGRGQAAAEMLVGWIRGTLVDSAGKEALKYFPFVFTLFVFVLFSNLFGMIPYAFTVTSHLVVTFAMAGLIFIACTLIAIFKHGPVKFAHFFLPHGTPWWMAWLVVPIEFFSYLSRPISLSIRLAANMTAGHITMKIIAGMIVTFGMVVGLTSAFPMLIFIIAFEFAIAIIQAYIFTVLTCVYLHDALHLH